jgi:hypothetical protein
MAQTAFSSGFAYRSIRLDNRVHELKRELAECTAPLEALAHKESSPKEAKKDEERRARQNAY